MISPFMAKLIGCLPGKFKGYVSDKILNGYLKKYADIKVTGMQNIHGVKTPILFVCNHLSNSDALVLGSVLKSQNLTFVAGKKLSENCLTKLGMSMTKTISINPNSADKSAISNIIKSLKNGENILMFPEGTRSRTASMNKAKRGVVLIERLSKASIIPIGLYGTEKLLPISSKNMALENFHHAEVIVNIGEKLEIPSKKKEEERHEYESRASDFIMYKIAELLPENYRGVYSFNEGDKFEQ